MGRRACLPIAHACQRRVPCLDAQARRQQALSTRRRDAEQGVCLSLQAASEQRPHKLSYSLSAKGDEAKAVLARLEDALKSKGITVGPGHNNVE